jgi:hypothetical protein
MNNKSKEIKSSTYFDKRVEEEDEPVILDEETQAKYEMLEGMYDDFFEEDFLGVAKVSKPFKYII